MWIRRHRHELLDEGFQAELAGMYDPRPLGQPPVPPALLALATILQAYTGASDDQVLEACVMDRRWQLVLDCMDHAEAPFSKGTLVAFRGRLIAHELDRRLVERTVELHQQQAGRPAAGRLRAALDASPLWGAGRVEDTINLMGHALRVVLGVLGGRQGWGLAAADRARMLAGQAGIGVLAGSSLKAALDCDWDDPAARQWALGGGAGRAGARRAARRALPGGDAPRVAGALAAARQVRDQDVTWVRTTWRGSARAWRVTGGSRSRIRRCATAARPSGCGSTATSGMCCETWTASWSGWSASPPPTCPRPRSPSRSRPTWTPRACGLASCTSTVPTWQASWSATVMPSYRSTARRSRSAPVGGRFAKPAFTIDFDRHTLTCPNSVVMPFTPGGKVQFPAQVCAACPLRQRCTTSPRGRSVQIHPDERLLVELRARQQTPPGRARLRERVAVEHALAHVGRWQGDRARYLGGCRGAPWPSRYGGAGRGRNAPWGELVGPHPVQGVIPWGDSR